MYLNFENKTSKWVDNFLGIVIILHIMKIPKFLSAGSEFLFADSDSIKSSFILKKWWLLNTQDLLL